MINYFINSKKKFLFSFSEGPSYEDYQSRTNADLGTLGGPRKARAEFKGSSQENLITQLALP